MPPNEEEVMVRHRGSILLFTFSILQEVYSNQRSVLQTQLPAPPSLVSIPVVLSHYNGTDAPAIDDCPRSEVKLFDGQCYQLLTQGPCSPTQYVALDPITNHGYCGPRLCAPDRIFVFNDQLCHDPRDPQLCPGGRELYQTSFATPVCQCPDGTYESDDDDQDEEACKPLLATDASCPSGQVLWFRNFSSPRECLPDPCEGQNIRRAPDAPLLVPSKLDGNCYPLGQGRGVCPPGTLFTLALNQLQGICSRLEDAGYIILDENQLADYEEFYGPLIPKDTNQSFPEFLNTISINSPITKVNNQSTMQARLLAKGVLLPSNPSILFSQEPKIDSKIIGVSISQSPVLQGPLVRGSIIKGPVLQYPGLQRQTQMPVVDFPSVSKHLKNSGIQLTKGRLVTETRLGGNFKGVFASRTSEDIADPIIEKFKATDLQFADTIAKILSAMSSTSRWKRSVERTNPLKYKKSSRKRSHRVPRQSILPHFSPGNIFDTRLVGCRSGSKRDVNAKCRDTILPSTTPSKPRPIISPASAASPAEEKEVGRKSRSAPPVQPRPLCPPGEAFNVQRQCEATSSAINSINAHNLG